MRNRFSKRTVLRLVALFIFVVIGSGLLIAQSRQFSTLTLHNPATLPVDM